MNARMLSIVASLASASCATVRMAVPPDIASASEELVITDRSSFSGALADETFNLGPYKVADVDRKWNSQRTTTLGDVETRRASGGYKFKLTGATTALSAVCETESRGDSADLGDGWSAGASLAKLSCSCSDAEGGAELALEASSATTYKGALKRGGEVAMVHAINEREGGGGSSVPTGYRVDADGAALGAVDVMGKGRVWISKTLEGQERAQLACVFAGLLLYQPPKDR